jgi:hypothetical protein
VAPIDAIDALQKVEGFQFPVCASPGTEDRGAAIGRRVERARDWLADLVEFQPRVRLLALAPADWDAIAEVPVFGFPHFINDDTIVVGSSAAPFFDEIVEVLRASASKPTWHRMQEVYGEPPRVHGFADLLVVHELGHLFHVQAGFWKPGTWLPELFCNVALEGYVAEVEPQSLELLETLPLAFGVVEAVRFPVRALDQMARAGEVGGPLNYAWFELRLHAAARSIWERGGRSVLLRLYERFRDDRTVDDVRTALKEIHPELARVIEEWPG